MDRHVIRDVSALEALYGSVDARSIEKEIDHLHPVYAAFVRAAPLCILATAGPGGLDASPRGDRAGFVEIGDRKTLLLPDRRGNNRIDSLRNILVDPRVALLFLVPGLGETLRVNGRAEISIDPILLKRFGVAGRPPRSVLVVAIETVFFQCSRALVRADIWNPDKRLPRSALPSTGTILAALSRGEFDGDGYDAALPERVRATLY
ncbi:pyridoxamine 5'-phosphate oxidase family protein [uncultured Enterovirga sp.]|uniref:pyridoxamine 5'-phosphate oxidase family protein n=1 Tax=uncultured Enterovirga sp. TaxID=2026352 RepID=UPI0035CC72D9